MDAMPAVDEVFAAGLFAGKQVLVTGGGTGLGLAIATQMATLDAHVVIAARRREILDEAAVSIRHTTGNDVAVDVVDIRDRTSVEALAERHTIDVLVNNAGGQFPQKARDFSPNGWRTVVDLNLNGTWSMTQVFGNQMLDGDGGVIVQIVAIVGRGLPGMAHSAAARAGVIEMTHTLAYEWGPKVRLNCVAPGAFHTEGWQNAYDEQVGADMTGVPLPYPGHPRDIANAVTFLASPAARYMTGQTMYVDGGHALHGHISALAPGGYPERELPPPTRV